VAWNCGNFKEATPLSPYIRSYEETDIGKVDIVKLCQDYFDFDLPSVMIKKRRKTFLARFDIVEKTCCT